MGAGYEEGLVEGHKPHREGRNMGKFNNQWVNYIRGVPHHPNSTFNDSGVVRFSKRC